MSIANEITNYANGLSDAYDAVNDMQGIIPTDKNMNNLDTAIRTIPQSQGATYTAGDGIDITNDVISATNTGKYKVLTSADYNWPENNPTFVSLGRLPQGAYWFDKGLQVGPGNFSDGASTCGGLVLISDFKSGSSAYKTLVRIDTTGGNIRTQIVTSEGGVSALSTLLHNGNIKNNLTTTTTGFVLDATQGKALKDLIDSIAISGAGAPTTSTAGTVGKLYEDTTNGKLYICTDVTGGVYTWTEVGSGGGPTVVQTLGSSTTDVMSQKATTDTIYGEYGQGIVIGAGPGWDDTIGSVALGKNVNLSDNYGEIGIGNFSSATTTEGISLGYRASSDHHGGASIGAYSSDDFTHESSDEYGYIAVGRNSALTFMSEVTGESTTIPAFTRRIVGVKDPVSSQDAATKNYVDTATSGKQDALTAGTNVSISNNVISATDTTYSNFTGATSSTAGTNGLVPAPAAGDEGKALHGDGTWKDTTAKLVEMSYGESNAWAKFIAAYNAGSIVYCRASSNANPGTGSQTRKAFMAYVNNATNPTNVEFQYVRSQSSKTDSQQCDQVFVYKLTNANGGTWTVESRNMAPKIVAGTGMSSTFTTGANATITLNAEPNYSTSEVDTKVKWVDGKTIYRKTINFGALPNATLKTVAHGISNLHRVIKYECMAYNSTSGNNTQVPLVSTAGNNSNLDINSTDVIMNTTTDRSSFDECYVTLYYTKSS